MSSIRTHRTRTAAVVLLAATGMAVAGSSVAWSSVASGDPGVAAPETCRESLPSAVEWPGEVLTEDGPVIRFSDAYYSYLVRLPSCAVSPATTPRCDDVDVGLLHLARTAAD